MATEKDIAVSTCEYKPETIRIMIDKDTIDIEPGNMSRFNIIKDYENSFFPVIQVGISLNRKQYDQIIENKTKVKIQLKVRKNITISSTNTKEEFINKLYVVYLSDNQPFLEEKEYKKRVEANQSNQTDGSDTAQEGSTIVDFFLFDGTMNEKTRTLMNTVFSNTNMTNVIAAAFTFFGISNILMEKLDNSSSYKEIVVPPLTIIGIIRYLDAMYGLYKEPHLLFFDSTTTYLISKSTATNAFRKKEIKKIIFYVRDTMTGDAKNGGYKFDKDQGTYTIDVDPDSFKIKTDTIINDQIEGNGRYLMNPFSNKKKTINPDTVQRGKPNLKYMTLKYSSNSYLSGHIEKELESQSNILSFTLIGVDIDILTPNKNFTIKFENTKIDKKHGGKYRIRNMYMSGNRRDTNYIPYCSIELVK